jgi:hypothetical protein
MYLDKIGSTNLIGEVPFFARYVSICVKEKCKESIEPSSAMMHEF